MRRDHDENGIIGTRHQHSSSLFEYQHKPPKKVAFIPEQRNGFAISTLHFSSAALCVCMCVFMHTSKHMCAFLYLSVLLSVCVTKVSRSYGVGSTKHRQEGGFNKTLWIWSLNPSPLGSAT